MPHPELERFEQSYRRAERLLANVSEDELTEVARILAIDLAQYQARYGELPAREYLTFTANHLTAEPAKTLADGMEVLADVLRSLPGHERNDDSVH